ncbi:glycosylhydrolase family 18-6 [Colletotrichum truncatum]|uniref:Glycosylhydrolase family 18-6 n=1 Tax=Colletotrichum truncatum TaxID=5467 RepID=A0ACC3ZHC7_COLTU|nr:glycosylhydrolase family 18-6 [Colletotrichum truncatum]KAF6780997.1 glycosylhydrolase family 18-6 [Colletotrichum truncatum]
MCGQTKFSAVAGMDSLKYGNWNGVTRGDLAASAVEWHKKKGNRADWSKPPDLSDGETARFLFDFYADGDFKVPGTGDIPVCSPKEAIKNWAEHYNDNPRWPEYPCNKP